MLNILWWGWVVLAFAGLIVAYMVASEIDEERALKRKRAEEAKAGESGEENAERPTPAMAEAAEQHREMTAAHDERRVPHYEPEPPAPTPPAPKRQRKPSATSSYAKPRSRKKAPARKAKKAKTPRSRTSQSSMR